MGVLEEHCEFERVYVGNLGVNDGLTHIFRYDASVPAYSPNLLGLAPPYTLLPAVPAVGDIVYFGIGVIPQPRPFPSLVFDLIPHTNITAGVWEYWNGAAWSNVWLAGGFQDNTANDGSAAVPGVPFDTAGVKSVHWEQPNTWAQTPVNGVNALWVRFRVTGVGANPTPPRQQNRHVYTITWAYTEVQDDQVEGDIAALLRAMYRNESNVSAVAGVLQNRQMALGLRSVDRGETFRAYLNCVNYQNPAGITWTSGAVLTADSQTPSGWKTRQNNIPAGWANLGTWAFAAPANVAYQGKYHVWLRAEQLSGGSGDLLVRLASTVGVTTIPLTEQRAFYPANTTALDMGDLALPPANWQPAANAPYTLILQVYGDGAVDADFIDMALIPTDEWAAMLFGLDQAVGYRVYERGDLTLNTYINADSVTMSKRAVYADVRRFQGDTPFDAVNPASSGLYLWPRSRQRIWTMSFDSVSPQRAHISVAHSMKAEKCDRYLSMRGEE